MTTRTTNTGRLGLPETDVAIDEFIEAHHEEVVAKLAAARGEIARGEAVALEPLEELLSEARTAR
jgi:hypothetical protein